MQKTRQVKLILLLSKIKVKDLQHHPIYWLDNWGHRLVNWAQLHNIPEPRFMSNALCDALDWWLGVWDDGEEAACEACAAGEAVTETEADDHPHCP